jgi:hypothetical protein
MDIPTPNKICKQFIQCSSMQLLGSSPSTRSIGEEGVDVDGIRKEGMELGSLMKEQLVKVASSAQVWVTCQIDGKSHQVSKPMMVCRLIAKKFGGIERASSKPAIIGGYLAGYNKIFLSGSL